MRRTNFTTASLFTNIMTTPNALFAEEFYKSALVLGYAKVNFYSFLYYPNFSSLTYFYVETIRGRGMPTQFSRTSVDETQVCHVYDCFLFPLL